MWNPLKRKPKEKTVEELEMDRLQDALAKETPGTNEYDKVQAQLTKYQEFTGKKIEMSQRFTKEARGNMWGKVIGAASIGGVSFLLAWYEKRGGNMFTGSNDTIIRSLLKNIGNLICKDKA